MDIPRCAHCGLPVESSNYYLRGMAIKCRNCGYSALPLSAGACIYDRIKVSKPEGPHEPFKEELNPRSVLSRLALLSFFSSAASVWSPELRFFTAASFAGFLLFSLMYGFLRVRDAA